MVELPADFHIHPGYSVDAEGSLDDFCEAALRAYVLEVCFTTHYDADPARPDEAIIVIDGRREQLSKEAIDHYLRDIGRVYSQYGQFGLTVRSGLEFGWFPGCEKPISDLLETFHLDFRLGAVHSIGEHCVCCRKEAPKLFAKLTLEQMADAYYARLHDCAASGLFDSLAHIDVYRRFGRSYYGEAIDTIHRGRIEKVFRVMKRNGTGLEINTSAIRHGLEQYYPSMEIINLARKKGVRIRSVGSDAHRPDQLALDFEAAAAIAYDVFPYVKE